jgi:hypothetical protein
LAQPSAPQPARQPSQQTIRFRIRPDGRVEETVEGLSGSACEGLTERIEARLGSVQQRHATSEAYQAVRQGTAVTAAVVQPLGAPAAQS